MRPKLLALAFALLLAVTIAPTSRPTQSVNAVAVEPTTTTTTAVTAPTAPTAPAQVGVAWTEALHGALVQLQFYDAMRQKQEAEAAAARAPAAPRVTSATADVQAPAAPEPTAAAPIDGGDAEAAVREYFGDIFSQAWAVTACESGHNPSAISPGGGNWGLFQINTTHKKSFSAVTGQSWDQVLNAHYNAQFARWLYDSSGGWGPWSCRWAAY